MITGFEEYTKELSQPEKEVLPYIAGYLERAQGPLTNYGMQMLLRNDLRWYPSAPRIRKIINVIRRSGRVTLLLSNSKGYYRANTKKEALDYLTSLDERIQAIQAIRVAIQDQVDAAFEPAGHGQLNMTL